MNIKFSTVALMGNHRDQRVLDTMRQLADYLSGKGVQVLVADTVNGNAVSGVAKRLPEDQLASNAGLIVAIGGDGTMFYAARLIAGTGIPLLGINRGRLGFLADISPDEMLVHLDEILCGNYVDESRMLIRAEIISGNEVTACSLAFNDVVVKRHDTGRMIEFQTYVDGRFVNTHRGDGLVVATPTGSTAYSLSCNGPILEPGLEAIVLTPISPHTLSDRPIIIPTSYVTEIRLLSERTPNAEVSCDGTVIGRIEGGDSIRVSVAGERVALIHPPGYDHFQILRSKLHWGHDSRVRNRN